MNINVRFKIYQDCWIMRDNKPTPFHPRAMKAECVYGGYSGENWGDESAGPGRGYPIRIYYSEDVYGNSEWVSQFRENL